VGSHPKQLIEALSEDLLRVFAGARLIDKYGDYTAPRGESGTPAKS
jgi:hypothetical protein